MSMRGPASHTNEKANSSGIPSSIGSVATAPANSKEENAQATQAKLQAQEDERRRQLEAAEQGAPAQPAQVVVSSSRLARSDPALASAMPAPTTLKKGIAKRQGKSLRAGGGSPKSARKGLKKETDS